MQCCSHIMCFCLLCFQGVLEASAEGGSIAVDSGAEVATVGALEGAEVVTGEDTDLARWTQGEIQ